MLTTLLSQAQRDLVNIAPKLLALPTSFVPFFVQKRLLNDLLKNLLKEAIEDGDLDFLSDKWLKVTISDLKLTWFISFEDEQLVIAENAPQTDVSFTAPVNDLILVAGRKEDPDTLFFQRRLSIEGDTELGLEVKNLLDNIEFDQLPDYATKAIDRFATFVQQGLALNNDKTLSKA